MTIPESSWEKTEAERWEAKNQEPLPTPENLKEPPVEIPEPPRKGSDRYYRITAEWSVIGIMSAWALLNAFDFGPSFYRFYRIGGTEFLLHAIFAGVVAHLGSHNRHSPLFWWCAAFFFPPVTLLYLIFFNHLRKTKAMWRQNDALFALSCVLYASSSIWIDSLLYRAVVYICCIFAALTAAIAEDKERSPVAWWAFGFFLPPAALFCAVLSVPADKDLWRDHETKVCPVCGDIMPVKLRACRFCDHIF